MLYADLNLPLFGKGVGISGVLYCLRPCYSSCPLESGHNYDLHRSLIMGQCHVHVLF